ncbi:tRNA preQ1(34) S-adenosylmethionine ribosyltransferase-isomerase QueA [Marinicellulosiphila megalodicopiae]|uniref:tRNA preQ1(34) S-adenosylmethionine ribosyltransferase-isomerase QueA n=1 Tax=Marinicellulosiphila megalodicopiae TaxID=2724896 RepID=UPI003BAEFD50
MLRVDDFDFELPDELIARYPSEQRTQSRLLHVDGQAKSIENKQFSDLLGLLESGDLLVLNNTKVMPARIYGKKASGGKIELLIERLMENNQALAHIRSSRSPKVGAQLILDGDVPVEVIGRKENLFLLQFESDILPLLDKNGHMPLPPYMSREDELTDRDRYQTVYAKDPGAVAAPTAGLHFDEAMLEAIEQKGVQIQYITLHVGAGTFAPVKVDSIEDHIMHHEWLHVPQDVCDVIKQTKQSGKKVVAVGTTTVRSLETAARASDGIIDAFEGDSDIFIFPGFKFKVVDAMITNFHLPKSTLLMLVSAFCGTSTMMGAYEQAIQNKYRFYSYGDAMFLSNRIEPQES